MNIASGFLLQDDINKQITTINNSFSSFIFLFSFFINKYRQFRTLLNSLEIHPNYMPTYIKCLLQKYVPPPPHPPLQTGEGEKRLKIIGYSSPLHFGEGDWG